jgi:hypothetical protein
MDNITCKYRKILKKYSKFMAPFNDIKDYQNLLEFFEEKYSIFLAIYNSSKGGENFFLKISELFVSKMFNNDFHETIRAIIYERFVDLMKIIPLKVFTQLGLKIYNYNEFLDTPIGILLISLKNYYVILNEQFFFVTKTLEILLHYENKHICLMKPVKIIIN